MITASPRAIGSSAFAAVLVLAGSLLAQGNPAAVQFTLQFPQDGLTIEEEVLPDQTPIAHIRVQGTDPTEEPGFPELPSVVRWVALPRGAQIIQVAASGAQDATLQVPGLISWAQRPAPGRNPHVPKYPQLPNGDPLYYPAPDTVGPDPSLLQVPIWPPVTAQVVETFEMAGYDVVKLVLYPVQWLPQQRTLIFHSLLSVSIAYQGGAMPQGPVSYPDQMQTEEIRSIVVNQEFIPPLTAMKTPEELDAYYLIITDNYLWRASFIERDVAVDGDMVAEFQRLADWKTEKGLKAAVVTVSDIVEGRYGNFKKNAAGWPVRDLQEVLRNFLKHARSAWGTYWVLLGGDVGVIPVREVVAWVGVYDRGSEEKPAENHSYWDSATETLRIHQPEKRGDRKIHMDSDLFSLQDGKLFHRKAWISFPDGWTFTADDTYSTFSGVETPYIILRGLAHPDYKVLHIADENRIPTDLYYSSLETTKPTPVGLHDWDLHNNFYYGMYYTTGSIDGVKYQANLALGRAPVESAAEAKAFVDKVMAYEKFQGIPGNIGRKVLFSATNWAQPPDARVTTTDPPEEGKYYGPLLSTSVKVHLAGPPGGGLFSWTLIAYNESGDWWEVPYSITATPASLGYYFCKDGTYGEASVLYTIVGGKLVLIPIPTGFLKVVGPREMIHPTSFFFDSNKPDTSVRQKEELRDRLREDAPGLDLRQRFYQDFDDTPPSWDTSPLARATIEAVTDAMSTGYTAISLAGHGWSGGCCATSYVEALKLAGTSPSGLIYADSCYTCQFEVGDAICEAFVKVSGGGAAAYVGNSRYSWIGSSAVLERAFWHGLTVTRYVGRLHNTKGYLADDPGHVWSNFSLNLMGDPQMSLWVGTPESFAVVHPAEVVKGDPLPVTVKTTAGDPINAAWVCVTGPRGFFDLRFSGWAGEASFPTSGAAGGDVLKVTVTKDGAGFYPYQGTVKVKAAFGSYVRGDSNLDGAIDISDAIATLNSLFIGTQKIPCPEAADSNGDGAVDISDAIFVLSYLFLGGKAPAGSPPNC